jgi:dihydroorotate dehydrogenase (NAD+) catalytic subunit
MTDDATSAPPDLSVNLAGLRLANPLMTASGTSGFGPEYSDLLDIRQLGAFTTKAVSVEPRKGNPPERIIETPGGMINAIGLANVGLERFVTDKVPYLASLGIPVVVNVVGHSVQDYLTVCRRLDEVACVSALELNVSCPNVADGLEFGTDPARLGRLVAAVRREVSRAKLIVKLSPNVTDITETAAAAVDAGADILSLINTIYGMAINVETWKPMLANRTGGLSGPAIKPVALYMVHKVYSRVARSRNVPIIGMGGITTWRDAVEFFLAGASAIAIGTALFVDPRTPLQILDGLADYLRRRNLRSLNSLTGRLG